MQYIRLRAFFYSFLVSVSLVSCQKVWVSQANEAPETNVELSAEVPADAAAEAIIVPYRQQLVQRMSQILGQSTQELRKGPGESALGNFVVDAQLVQAQKIYKKPIDLSLMTSGGLRNPIPAGQVTLGNIFELMPFENQMLVLTLPGTTVQKLFEHGARVNDLSIGNATFTIQDKKPVDVLINGKPLNINQNYTLLVSDYLAYGGDNLAFLKESTKVEPLNILHRDMLIRHIQELTAQNKAIEARIEGRIKQQ